MISRKKFILSSALASTAALFGIRPAFSKTEHTRSIKITPGRKPVVISTWNHGIPANAAAWEILSKNGRALDAVEKGVRVTESDPKITSVGYGGLPDRDGHVTLDSCIMDENLNGGSVGCIEHIMNPISVARLVMEKTPHVMLVGEGALQFALQNSFKKENLLTEESKKAWENWKERNNYTPVGEENHDTIGMLAIDEEGRLCGACTTSGLAYKMHGRVGDSPIIGAGLFVDGEVGGAVATGLGELVMKTLGTFLVVEFMRNGMSPQKACQAAVKRIVQKIPNYEEFQIGYLALDKNGNYGAFCLQPGFEFAVKNDDETDLKEAEAWLKKL